MPDPKPAASLLRDFIVFVGRVWSRFDKDRCFAAAASLSYTSLLALVPLIAISFAVMSAFPVFDNVQAEMQAFIVENFIPSAVNSIQEHFDSFVTRARGLTAAGVVGLAVTSLMLFVTIETAIDAIFKSTERRPMAMRLLTFWTILTLGPLLIGASFSVASLAYHFTQSQGGSVVLQPLVWLSVVAPSLLVIAGFTFFYMLIPSQPVRFWHALIGGIVAGAVFSLLRWGFTIYVSTFPGFNNLYGTLATIPIFLFWMYLSWAVVLMGAVITAEMPAWRQPVSLDVLPPEPGARLGLALSLLSALYRSTQQGGGAKLPDLVKHAQAPAATVDAMLRDLRSAQLVDRSEGGYWIPVRDSSAVSLRDVIHDLSLDLSPEDLLKTAHGEAWPERIAGLLEADAEQSRDTMSLRMRTLLIEDEPDALSAVEVPEQREHGSIKLAQPDRSAAR